MRMPAPDGTSARKHSRAKIACKACHARRVRCNAMEIQPCSNCDVTGLNCELIESRRGRYERQRSKPSRGTRAVSHRTIRVEPAEREREDTGSGSVDEEAPRQPAAGDSDVDVSPDHTLSIVRMDEPQLTMASSSSTHSAITPSSHETQAESTVFLGEASSISLLHGARVMSEDNNTRLTEQLKLRYPIPDSIQGTDATNPHEIDRRATDVERLLQGNAFKFPPTNVREVLLGAYFTWFHPCYPIVDRSTFCQLYLSKRVPALLLQAILFIGASHCNEKTMEELDVRNRQALRSDLYYRAKDIYDADFETDKITVAQALILMSFWRKGPLLEKDTRHWLGAAINLAQTKGMHRLSPNVNLTDRKVRKKIWWTLYLRDRQCSAALGLPIRIRDEDCDVEPPQVEDFEEDLSAAALPAFMGVQTLEHVLYFIHMTKLAKLLGHIVLGEFAPGNTSALSMDKMELKGRIMAWESELSSEMGANATSNSFWASSLHVAYNNLYILLFRSDFLAEPDGSRSEQGRLVLHAASRSTRIIEDMLCLEMCRHGNVHLITSFFNTLCIHTAHLRRSDGTARKLTEYRAHICLLGLRELQETWDVANWVLQLFLQFLDKSIVHRLRILDTEQAPASDAPSDARGPNQDPPRRTASSTVQCYNRATNLQAQFQPRDLTLSLDFASHIFGTKEAEDFSLFQLQPELFQTDFFDGSLDRYYSSFLPHNDPNQPL